MLPSEDTCPPRVWRVPLAEGAASRLRPLQGLVLLLPRVGEDAAATPAGPGLCFESSGLCFRVLPTLLPCEVQGTACHVYHWGALTHVRVHEAIAPVDTARTCVPQSPLPLPRAAGQLAFSWILLNRLVGFAREAVVL